MLVDGKNAGQSRDLVFFFLFGFVFFYRFSLLQDVCSFRAFQSDVFCFKNVSKMFGA